MVDAQRFIRCDGAWLEGNVMTKWGFKGGFSEPPPTGAFAFEMPQLCSAAKAGWCSLTPG
jgi:hypothetical protein